MLTTIPKKILWLAAFGAVVLIGTKVATNVGNRATK